MTAAVAAPAVQAPPSMAIQANEALARGELALADSLCREALRRSPRDVVALCVSGHVALALQRFHHAQVFFGRAQALQPQSTDIADWRSSWPRRSAWTRAWTRPPRWSPRWRAGPAPWFA